MNVKMRSVHSEWIVLTKFFGKDYISKMFNNFMSYKELRNKNTYQQIYDELIKLKT